MPVVLAAPRIPGDSEGTYSQIVDVDGVRYGVVVRQGKRVRIPYQPRVIRQMLQSGQTRTVPNPSQYGYKIEGLVYQSGRCLFSGHVARGTGVKRMLYYAGVVDVHGRSPLDARAHFHTRSREWLTRSR